MLRTWPRLRASSSSRAYSRAERSTGSPLRSTVRPRRSIAIGPTSTRSGAQRAIGSADQRAQPGEQLLEGEGLAEVIVGAGVQPIDAVRQIPERGQHQDRGGVALGAELADDAGAVELGQHPVEDDRVVGVGQGGVQALIAIREDIDREPLLGQDPGNDPGESLLRLR